MMKISDPIYYIWLSFRLGAASKYFIPLSEYFDDVFEIYRAEEDVFSKIEGLPEKVIASLCNKELETARKCLYVCAKNKVKISVFGDQHYPLSLMNMEDPPILLYYFGEIPDLSSKLSVSIVGTRKMSEYGKHTAYKISYELGAADIITVSGMALGIDGVASCGALEGGGKVIAVLGSGLDVVYPREHRKLMGIIMNRGAVISEYPPGTRPEARNFPVRNRIISALSMGTLVIEGDMKSGSLITARHAIYQGKPVFAIPGNVGEENAEGTNALLRAGAHVVVESDDIVDYFRNNSYFGQISIDEVMFKKAHIVKADCDVALYNMKICSRIYGRNYNFGGKPTSRELLEKEQKNSLLATPVSNLRRNVNSTASDDTDAVKGKVSNNSATGTGEREHGKHNSDHSVEVYASLTETQKKIFDAIPIDECITADNLSKLSDSSMSDVLMAITMLELKGLIMIHPGGKYERR